MVNNSTLQVFGHWSYHLARVRCVWKCMQKKKQCSHLTCGVFWPGNCLLVDVVSNPKDSYFLVHMFILRIFWLATVSEMFLNKAKSGWDFTFFWLNPVFFWNKLQIYKQKDQYFFFFIQNLSHLVEHPHSIFKNGCGWDCKQYLVLKYHLRPLGLPDADTEIFIL